VRGRCKISCTTIKVQGVAAVSRCGGVRRPPPLMHPTSGPARFRLRAGGPGLLWVSRPAKATEPPPAFPVRHRKHWPACPALSPHPTHPTLLNPGWTPARSATRSPATSLPSPPLSSPLLSSLSLCNQSPCPRDSDSEGRRKSRTSGGVQQAGQGRPGPAAGSRPAPMRPWRRGGVSRAAWAAGRPAVHPRPVAQPARRPPAPPGPSSESRRMRPPRPG
jgi:hypothetical protein